jgi:hypothetical protein
VLVFTLGEIMGVIKKLLESKQLLRGTWSNEYGGMCLFTGLAGYAEARPSNCHLPMCPGWLARLLPWIDDGGTIDAWIPMIIRIDKLMERFPTLTGATELQVLAVFVDWRLRYATEPTASLLLNEYAKVLAMPTRISREALWLSVTASYTDDDDVASQPIPQAMGEEADVLINKILDILESDTNQENPWLTTTLPSMHALRPSTSTSPVGQ